MYRFELEIHEIIINIKKNTGCFNNNILLMTRIKFLTQIILSYPNY